MRPIVFSAAPPLMSKLRVRKGMPFHATVENRPAKNTTVHWHGVRLPNGMDDVPVLTQKPISPGERVDYGFTPPDAGTFWYPRMMTAWRSWDMASRVG